MIKKITLSLKKELFDSLKKIAQSKTKTHSVVDFVRMWIKQYPLDKADDVVPIVLHVPLEYTKDPVLLQKFLAQKSQGIVSFFEEKMKNP